MICPKRSSEPVFTSAVKLTIESFSTEQVTQSASLSILHAISDRTINEPVAPLALTSRVSADKLIVGAACMTARLCVRLPACIFNIAERISAPELSWVFNINKVSFFS